MLRKLSHDLPQIRSEKNFRVVNLRFLDSQQQLAELLQHYAPPSIHPPNETRVAWDPVALAFLPQERVRHDRLPIRIFSPVTFDTQQLIHDIVA